MEIFFNIPFFIIPRRGNGTTSCGITCIHALTITVDCD